jgi:hypothetical protein
MTTSWSDKQDILPVVRPTEAKEASPTGEPKAAAAEVRTDVNNNGNVDKQQNYSNVGVVNNHFSSSTEAPSEIPLEDLPEDLPRLPLNLHPFRDPCHSHLLTELQKGRILLLTSYQERAAYAAAYSLVNESYFDSKIRRALFPAAGKLKDRTDLDIDSLAQEQVLKTPQILFIEIGSGCTLFYSALTLDWGRTERIREQLEKRSSYLILAVNEELVLDDTKTQQARECFPFHSVSHLRYLLAPAFRDRAEELEKRVLEGVARWPQSLEKRELYQKVTDLLAKGPIELEEYIAELEKSRDLPLALWAERFQPVRPEEILRQESEAHRAAAYLASFIPDLGLQEFDRLAHILLGDAQRKVENERKILAADGTVNLLQEFTNEPWVNFWRGAADLIFRECYLRTIEADDGSWVVDFTEPYLRRELRLHFDSNFPWYVRRQCQRLQVSGILFAADLSQSAVEGLVHLFVERAIADPASFGVTWLVELVLSLQVEVAGEHPSGPLEERLAWVVERLAVEIQLRKRFYSRLAFLIHEMLEREPLRPIVHEFLEFLIAVRKHDTLLNVVLGLARRLRFAPHFDPLAWMRRLLNQGGDDVRARTAKHLAILAMQSGPRIYDFLSIVKNWLPEEGRPSERFSSSNRIALDFPFNLCLEIARSLPPERFGVWPSRHPLFYALPANPAEARNEIRKLVEWILDPRGATLETADKTETMRTAEVVRIGLVADLVEHWAWVLEGGTEDGSPEGRALFQVIIEEIDRQIGPQERTWLQRSWQQRQGDYLRQAAAGTTSKGTERALLVAHRAKLDQLRMRFAALANHQKSAGEASETMEGITP